MWIWGVDENVDASTDVGYWCDRHLSICEVGWQGAYGSCGCGVGPQFHWTDGRMSFSNILVLRGVFLPSKQTE